MAGDLEGLIKAGMRAQPAPPVMMPMNDLQVLSVMAAVIYGATPKRDDDLAQAVEDAEAIMRTVVRRARGETPT